MKKKHIGIVLIVTVALLSLIMFVGAEEAIGPWQCTFATNIDSWGHNSCTLYRLDEVGTEEIIGVFGPIYCNTWCTERWNEAHL